MLVFRHCGAFLRHSRRQFVTFKNIDHFGTVRLDCPQISTIIRYINPHEVPNGDEAFVNFVDHVTGELLTEPFSMKVDARYCKEESVLQITQNTGHKVDPGVSLLLQIPHNYNLDVIGKDVTVQETEGDSLRLQSSGDCVLGKIKAGTVDVTCSGALTCKNILGNGTLFSVGDSTFKKIQAKHLSITTNGGDVDISSCYCPALSCTTTANADAKNVSGDTAISSPACGDIRIGSLHGSSRIRTQSGDVNIDTLDGDLDVVTESGDVKVTIEQCGDVSVLTDDGDIEVGLGDDLSTFIEGSGAHVDVPEDLLFDGMKREYSTGMQHFEGKLGSGENSSVNVNTAHGAVAFSRKNWFSKFNVDLD